jgi:hypothetical protein
MPNDVRARAELSGSRHPRKSRQLKLSPARLSALSTEHPMLATILRSPLEPRKSSRRRRVRHRQGRRGSRTLSRRGARGPGQAQRRPDRASPPAGPGRFFRIVHHLDRAGEQAQRLRDHLLGLGVHGAIDTVRCAKLRPGPRTARRYSDHDGGSFDRTPSCGGELGTR